ncbi:MAG: hypothetical protein DBY32_07365 [Phascolarctobacterium sp.]|nr:MAG: hypothetical protein DBY32_07365 [Phascolarctobacterium sp.]
MKKKNLERAVLLTVFLMSLHSGAYAVDAPVVADGSGAEQTITTSSENTTIIELTNKAPQSVLNATDSGKITVDGNGNLTVKNYDVSVNEGDFSTVLASNGGVINFQNEGNVDIDISANMVPFYSMYAVNINNANMIVSDESKLNVNVTGNTGTRGGSYGIYLTKNGSIDIGTSGASINFDGEYTNTSLVYISSSKFNSDGVIDITAKGDASTGGWGNGLVTNGFYVGGSSEVTLHDKLNISLEGQSNQMWGLRDFSNSEVTIDGDVEISVVAKELPANTHFTNTLLHYGIYGSSNLTLNGDILKIKTVSTGQGYGIQRTGGELKAKNVDITAEGKSALGIYVINTSADQPVDKTEEVNFAGGTISVKGTEGFAQALRASAGGKIKSSDSLIIKAESLDGDNYGIYAHGGIITLDNLDITTSGNNDVALYAGYYTTAQTNNETKEVETIYHDEYKGNATIKGNAKVNADITAKAEKAGTAVTFEKGLQTSEDKNTQIIANEGGAVKVNTTGEGIVVYKGVTTKDDNADSIVDMNLNNAQSIWKMTGNSQLTTFSHANNAVLDMTQDSGAYSTLTTTDMKGDGGIIKMDVDTSTNTNNSDRLYITGTHEGNHLIQVTNNVGEDAVGTVLVSVKDEQGTFAAEKTESALYWNSYGLAQQESTDTTGTYTTDWVIDEVKQEEGATTSVSAILGANALNYHTWRAENDQLMRRMGELRANGEDEQGAWFRVHGSKISRDDNAAFENEYTSYELGYDQVTKKTAGMTRYTGAALSYTDGSSSYERGSGENHSKSISFYNTDIYDSGHYLDLVFKFANMDNDFNVFDTAGNAISGEYKNNGISLSAEYGYKNDLNAGWYIEPQAQLTLGYFGGDEYETSNGIKVEQGGIASVLGRVGFNIGKQFGDNGVVYAKANLLHEFAGDYDIEMTDSSGVSRSESASFNDTWFEYGIGAALKTGKNNHLYFDFVKTAGGDFEKDWQWNAGMRWTF